MVGLSGHLMYNLFTRKLMRVMIKDEIVDGLMTLAFIAIAAFLSFIGLSFVLYEGIQDNPRTIIEIKKKTLEGQIYHFNTLVQIESTCEVVEEHFKSSDSKKYFVGLVIEKSYRDYWLIFALFLLVIFSSTSIWGIFVIIELLRNLYLCYTA